MSSALNRLLEKTLPVEDDYAAIRKKKLTPAQRKARRNQAEKKSQLKESLDPKLAKTKKALQRMKNLAALEKIKSENEDLEELQKKILEKREAMKPEPLGRRTKRKSKRDVVEDEDEDESGTSKSKVWDGLTPGLAPVGYEPDEDVSDSD